MNNITKPLILWIQLIGNFLSHLNLAKNPVMSKKPLAARMRTPSTSCGSVVISQSNLNIAARLKIKVAANIMTPETIWKYIAYLYVFIYLVESNCTNPSSPQDIHRIQP